MAKLTLLSEVINVQANYLARSFDQILRGAYKMYKPKCIVSLDP